MAPLASETVEIVNCLVGTCQDGQAGFETAAAMVADPPLKAELLQYSLQRCDFIADLKEIVLQLGETPDWQLAIPDALRHGWTHLHGLMIANDQTILSACARGERTGIAAYRRALEGTLPDCAVAVVISQCQAIRQVYERIRSLRNAALRKHLTRRYR